MEDIMSIRIFSIRLFIVMGALSLIAASALSQSQPNPAAQDKMGTLVTTEWLSQHLDDPDLVILDCTVRMVPDESGGMKSVEALRPRKHPLRGLGEIPMQI